jgi:hypothetical protein
MEGRTTELISNRSTLKPKFLYYRIASQLHRVHSSLETVCKQTPGYAIRYGCSLSELTGASLLITGGFERYTGAAREVTRLRLLESGQSPLNLPCILVD